MAQKHNISQKQKAKIDVLVILTVAAILLLTIAILRPLLKEPRQVASRVVCGTILSGLTKAIAVYAQGSDGRYPTPDKWCDLLLQYVTKNSFICPDARRKGDNGPSHYAINPNATPASDPNMVLLFETKAGWNQFGGPEILTTENHDGKYAAVAFVDGHVEYMEKKHLRNLKWK